MFDFLRGVSRDSFLSIEESNEFKKNGCLLVKNAIRDPIVLDQIEGAIDQFDTRQRKNGVDHRGITLDEHKNAIYFEFISENKWLIDLVTWPATFHKVWGLLGWNIFCFLTNLIVSPPDPKAKRFQSDRFTFKEIHQDGGRIKCEAGLANILQLKVAFFISDCTGDYDGNLSIIPGSHTQNLFDYGAPQNASKAANDAIDYFDPKLLADDAKDRLVPVKAARGDAFIFDQRLWHTRSKNVSDKIRKVLFYGYTYRWIRGFDYYCPHSLSNTYDGQLNPILKQMLDWSKNEDYDSGQFVNTPLPLQDLVSFLENVGVVRDGILQEPAKTSSPVISADPSVQVNVANNR